MSVKFSFNHLPLAKASFLVAAAMILLVACQGRSEKFTASKDSINGELIIGFSQMNHINPWRVAETNDMRMVAEQRGYTLLLVDADSSQERQIQDIKRFINQGADYIICTPLVFTGWEEAFLACREAGVPLIMLDREAEGEPGRDFLTFVGSNFVKEGKMAAQWLANEVGGQARIVELKGNLGASCTIDREFGFAEQLKNFPGMQVIETEFGDFERIKGQQVMEQIILTRGADFDAVYAHNDEMAIGAIQALKAANMKPGQDVVVVSIDGSRDALKAIIAGQLGATVECTPRLATTVFDAIELHRSGASVPSRIEIEDRLFDRTNAAEHINEVF